MKKLIAMICAVAMMFAVAIPGMANPSIEETETIIEEAIPAEALSEESEGFEVAVMVADPEAYADEAVSEAVTKVNDAGEVLSVAEVAEMLKASNGGEVKLTSDKGNAVDPSEYSFVTKFMDIALTDGSEVKFDDNGKAVSVKAKVSFGALAGMQDTSTLADYLIMLIDPETGKIYYIELDEATFDPETGSVTVDFPCLGTFSLIKK